MAYVFRVKIYVGGVGVFVNVYLLKFQVLVYIFGIFAMRRYSLNLHAYCISYTYL